MGQSGGQTGPEPSRTVVGRSPFARSWVHRLLRVYRPPAVPACHVPAAADVLPEPGSWVQPVKAQQQKCEAPPITLSANQLGDRTYPCMDVPDLPPDAFVYTLHRMALILKQDTAEALYIRTQSKHFACRNPAATEKRCVGQCFC